MKQGIGLPIIFLFAFNAIAGSSASHEVRIVILHPNYFEVCQKTPKSETNHMDLKENSNSDFMLGWCASTVNKRITVAVRSGGIHYLLEVRQNSKRIEIIRVDENPVQLTDHLTYRRGSYQLHWIADVESRSAHASAIVYTLTDSF